MGADLEVMPLGLEVPALLKGRFSWKCLIDNVWRLLVLKDLRSQKGDSSD